MASERGKIDVYRAAQESPTADANQLLLERNWLQIGYRELFGQERWISVSGVLRRYTGTHYVSVSDDLLIRDIAHWCDTYAVVKRNSLGREVWVNQCAKPACVRQLLEWAKQLNAVSHCQVNPPGFNLANGRLTIEWEGRKPRFRLLPHSPEHYYTYCSPAKYDPKADPTECDRLLKVLDPPQRDIFLKTIAATLDLPTVRKHLGRKVRALLCAGVGNNGKDTLREAVKAAFGGQRAMTACNLNDFKQYDNGRKFPLSPLGEKPLLNWSSENSSDAVLDSLQSLKAAITGDEIAIEKKGQDEFYIKPETVFIFNINEVPKINGGLEAIVSRYAIVTFNKVFKDQPDRSQGELPADPRFKDDPEFLTDKVLPAFINRVLDALTRLMEEGIDFSCTSEILSEAQRDTNHLIAFCQDEGLVEKPDVETPVKEIWSRLCQWYKDNEYLEIDAYKRKTWNEPRCGDKLVRASNQVRVRFKRIFPKAKWKKPNNKAVVVGIEFQKSKKVSSLEGRELESLFTGDDDRLLRN